MSLCTDPGPVNLFHLKVLFSLCWQFTDTSTCRPWVSGMEPLTWSLEPLYRLSYSCPRMYSSLLVVIIIYSFKKYHQVFHFMRNQSYSWVKNKLAHFPRQKKPKVSIFDDVWETQQLSVNCLRRRNPGSSLLHVFWSAPLTTGNVHITCENILNTTRTLAHN